jgi:hypothetical protein
MVIKIQPPTFFMHKHAKKALTPTFAKFAAATAILLCFMPFASVTIQLPCVQGSGCATSGAVLLSPVGAFLFSSMFPPNWRVSIGVDVVMLLVSAVISYVAAGLILYAFEMHARR